MSARKAKARQPPAGGRGRQPVARRPPSKGDEKLTYSFEHIDHGFDGAWGFIPHHAESCQQVIRLLHDMGKLTVGGVVHAAGHVVGGATAGGQGLGLQVGDRGVHQGQAHPGRAARVGEVLHELPQDRGHGVDQVLVGERTHRCAGVGLWFGRHTRHCSALRCWVHRATRGRPGRGAAGTPTGPVRAWPGSQRRIAAVAPGLPGCPSRAARSRSRGARCAIPGPWPCEP